MRSMSLPLAGCDVVINDSLEAGLKLGHGFAVKRNDVVDVQNPADDDLVFGIEEHAGGVAPVGHGVFHGLIPAFSRNSRTASIW
jgi:hypothetical protein